MEVNYEETAESLKIWNNTYDIQKDIDRFIIWKFSIKWKVYTEMLFNSNLIIINGFGNRKERKKIDIMFNLFKEVQKLVRMERNKIYIIFNMKNLKQLLRRASRRKKRNEEDILLKEVEMDLYLGKVNKNWRTRRKKPPDKIMEIILTPLNIRDYHKRKNEIRNQEQLSKKSERKLE
jgi:hypothetical protein